MTDTGEDSASAHASSKSQPPDLSTPDAIRHLYETTFAQKREAEEWRQEWLASHAAMLLDIRNASAQQLATPEFQRRLWEDNPVSSSGASSVSMKDVVENRELAEWIGQTAKSVLPPHGPERLKTLQMIYGELCDRIKPLTARMPRLRILRVMAALFPEDYSNVVSDYRLRAVGRATCGRLSRVDREDNTLLNARVLGRLADILGPVDGSPEQLALRGQFVWFLWETINGGKEDDGADEPGTDTEILGEPLSFPPVARRLKGISPIPDPMETILETVEFVSRNRPIRSAVVEFILSEHPNVQKNSASLYLNCIWNTFGMFQLNGEALELTAEGKAFLDSENPDILIRPLLTKSIGPDLVLWRLNQRGPTPRTVLIENLQNHYRRWTTIFMPNSILAWGRSFDLWAAEPDGKYALTERGKKWARRLSAEPLPVTTPIDEADDGGEEVEALPALFTAPSLSELLDAFRKGPLVIPDEVVMRLHAALHASDRKHFVLLSGLSGTGKTQIAITYANAYHRIPRGKPNPYLLLAAVQPDWTDPSGLLGYVNPLGSTPSYMRTECLKFLLMAHEHPGIPYILCLDEMNLARAEYYFAPFLSAMETGGKLVFHHEDSAIDNVPPFIPWPTNLYVLGTVNMDETTHAFSDKVLDRAFTIEFWEVDLDEYAKRFAKDEGNQGFPSDIVQEVIGALKEAAAILKVVHQHFGYRTAGEVLGFTRACGNGLPRVSAIDHGLFMKVLPKLRGQDTDPMRKALEELRAWAEKRGFAVTAAKIFDMLTELRGTGTTSFWR